MNDDVHLTENERLLLKILKRRKGKPLTTLELVELHYKGRERPTFARQSVVVAMNALIRKMGGSVMKSRRLGPHPVKFWIA